MTDRGWHLEGSPEWQPELLKGWNPVDLDRVAAGYETKAAGYLLAASLWAGLVFVYLSTSVVFGFPWIFVPGFPLTLLFISYCYQARRAIELAKHTRIRCDNDGLC